MKALIILFMLVSVQAFSQAVIFYQKVNSVQLFTVTEYKNAKNEPEYSFSNERFVTPIEVNDSTWKVNVPINQFTMLLIDNKEWIGIKPNNYRYDAHVYFTFDDQFITIVEFDVIKKRYVDNFYADIVAID